LLNVVKKSVNADEKLRSQIQELMAENKQLKLMMVELRRSSNYMLWENKNSRKLRKSQSELELGTHRKRSLSISMENLDKEAVTKQVVVRKVNENFEWFSNQLATLQKILPSTKSPPNSSEKIQAAFFPLQSQLFLEFSSKSVSSITISCLIFDEESGLFQSKKLSRKFFSDPIRENEVHFQTLSSGNILASLDMSSLSKKGNCAVIQLHTNMEIQVSVRITSLAGNPENGHTTKTSSDLCAREWRDVSQKFKPSKKMPFEAMMVALVTSDNDRWRLDYIGEEVAGRTQEDAIQFLQNWMLSKQGLVAYFQMKNLMKILDDSPELTL